MKQNEKFVITISRELGCGGAYVGQQLAKKLGVFYADREIITRTAEQLSVKAATVEKHEETIPSFWNTFINSPCVYPDLYVPPVMLAPTEYDLFVAESDVIKRIAAERSVVIIGRCAFHVLGDHPQRVSVYLHAAPEFRIARYAKLYNVSLAEAEKTVAKCDKERAHYCKNFTGRVASDARNYDLSIDTARLDTLDKAVEFVLDYMRLR
jgi:cytidylate kinase